MSSIAKLQIVSDERTELKHFTFAEHGKYNFSPNIEVCITVNILSVNNDHYNVVNNEAGKVEIKNWIYKILSENMMVGNFKNENIVDGIQTKIRNIISEDIAKDWKVSHISSRLGMSEITLRRRLQSEETTCSKIIRYERLRQALILLNTTDLAITQIAYMTGFASSSHFSRVIKDSFNMTAREIRKRGG
ncbi:helix-turn-helix transcriptional regulator [Kiloniella sp. EL199]|uniref:helix-turn-helix transcriptional regulator n=1 Tax=Kiloniella sp. EL199 TaxID=2107581 RepID=UPI000EA025D2|nr:helix-turn-helix transcriptional regulator [Kiloniella sp. EL199]